MIIVPNFSNIPKVTDLIYDAYRDICVEWSLLSVEWDALFMSFTIWNAYELPEMNIVAKMGIELGAGIGL